MDSSNSNFEPKKIFYFLYFIRVFSFFLMKNHLSKARDRWIDVMYPFRSMNVPRASRGKLKNSREVLYYFSFDGSIVCSKLVSVGSLLQLNCLRVEVFYFVSFLIYNLKQKHILILRVVSQFLIPCCLFTLYGRTIEAF